MEKNIIPPKKVRPYGNYAMQQKKVNRFLCIGLSVYYFLMFLIALTSFVRGYLSIRFLLYITITAILSGIINTIVYKKDPSSTKLRYIAFIGLLLIAFSMGYYYEPAYIRFFSLIPMIGAMIYYDERYSITACSTMTLINVIIAFIKIVITKTWTGDLMVDNLCTVGTITMMMGIMQYTVILGHRFNHDTLYNLKDEKAAQEIMMNEVLAIAGNVRTETASAKDIVDQLDSSTDVVNGAITDISSSTLNTAENIQEQTVMTQQIQTAITDTLSYASEMVQTAKKSNSAIEESMQVMVDLKNHSAVIAETSTHVAETMQRLQEKTHDVKDIASMIYSISSQTNLLALNASIESARAGEAGRSFAVVATQIRNLAEETRKETENIENILKELNENAQEASDAVAQSAEATQAEDVLIENASSTFESIRCDVTNLTENIEKIDTMLNDLSSANNQIVDSITQLSATTEEVTASSQQAAEISSENKTHANTTKQLLDTIMDSAHRLDQYVK